MRWIASPPVAACSTTRLAAGSTARVAARSTARLAACSTARLAAGSTARLAACIALCLAAGLAACSGGAGPGPTPPRPAPDERDHPVPETAPSEAECDALITHAVALGLDEAAARTPPPRTTASDHEAVRRALHEDFVAGCLALPRAALRCALAASTLDALSACQRTPSSSTSNSSVAPGGMTPPAPRSP